VPNADGGFILSKTYHIHTFGCQMNVADSGHVAAQLEALGYQPVLQPDAADVIVINTCVVRQSAEDKAIGKLGALLPIKRRKPDAVIGLMGCMVGVKPSPALVSRFPWVDVFMPPSEPGPLIGHLLERELGKEALAVDEAEVLARHALQDRVQPLPVSRQLPGRSNSVLQSVRHLTQASGGQSPVAAHVPVVYGCSHACTFCIIPFRRGVERSRPPEEIVAEVRDLVSQGGARSDAAGPDRRPLWLRPARPAARPGRSAGRGA
jgi:tRNA-2-methylthio-N6-dimethylallyladenosine synthase